VVVFAIMSTFSANGIKNLADTAQLVGESMEGWLRGFEGYAGLLILTNEAESRARVMTFWTSREALEASARGRESVRNSLAERLGVTVESVESYEVSRRADLALG
jgi:heme-degrading monooxygenase HmoA